VCKKEKGPKLITPYLSSLPIYGATTKVGHNIIFLKTIVVTFGSSSLVLKSDLHFDALWITQNGG
jgi:hypothetical protein